MQEQSSSSCRSRRMRGAGGTQRWGHLWRGHRGAAARRAEGRPPGTKCRALRARLSPPEQMRRGSREGRRSGFRQLLMFKPAIASFRGSRTTVSEILGRVPGLSGQLVGAAVVPAMDCNPFDDPSGGRQLVQSRLENRLHLGFPKQALGSPVSDDREAVADGPAVFRGGTRVDEKMDGEAEAPSLCSLRAPLTWERDDGRGRFDPLIAICARPQYGGGTGDAVFGSSVKGDLSRGPVLVCTADVHG
jgi:hypothetical protein